YSTQSRAYRVFNKRTKVIVETIHVNFDELPHMASDHVSSDPVPQSGTVTTSNELDLLFSLMFDELLNESTQVVSKSSAETTADAPNKLESIEENVQVKNDEFINIFCTPVQDRGETSSRHVDSSNMYTFYQRHRSEHRWMKDHPLGQVIGNPSQSVRTRRQLELDGEMRMLALTVSQTEPKNIKEAMADSVWIESMLEEIHQFDRLDLWELVDRPLCKNVINMKWLWKNKCDEENIVIRNKSLLVAKGCSKGRSAAAGHRAVAAGDFSDGIFPAKPNLLLTFRSIRSHTSHAATPQIHHNPPPLPPQRQPPPHCHVHHPVTLSTVTIYHVTTSPRCPHHQHHHSNTNTDTTAATFTIHGLWCVSFVNGSKGGVCLVAVDSSGSKGGVCLVLPGRQQ
nr:Gag-Pol polyprotein [Tanacetum cinerariifolium]